MKTKFLSLIFLMFFATSCGGDDNGPGTPPTSNPSNLNVTYNIVGNEDNLILGNGSGIVEFDAKATNAESYVLEYKGSSFDMVNGKLDLTIEESGTVTVQIKAIGSSGTSISKTESFDIVVEKEMPDELLQFLTADGSQKWRIKSESTAHMGVGPKGGATPDFYSSKSFEKEKTSMYDDEYVLNTAKTFTSNMGGAIYGKENPLIEDFGSTSEPVNEQDEIENYPLDDFNGSWGYTVISGQDTFWLGDNGFLGFYVGGTHVYTILERTESEMVVRTLGADDLYWFFILSKEAMEVVPNYTNMVFEDDFSKNGSPDADKWTYDLGDGSGAGEPGKGWGNNESQYYTDRTDNVLVEDGVLRIIAKKENLMGSPYTSTRMKTEGKFDFTYGRVDVKAKLPSGGGTWPAIWMLGSNYKTDIWPKCGEIDITEYTGNNPGKVLSSLHSPSSFGATVNTQETAIENENDQFHIYSVIWSEDQIYFLLDGERIYAYNPLNKDSRTWPFNQDQFLILNIAMGGTLGGDIDPGFTTSEMIIDYVRVYQ